MTFKPVSNQQFNNKQHTAKDIARDCPLQAVMIASAGYNFTAISSKFVLLPMLALDTWGLGGAGLGVAIGAMSLTQFAAARPASYIADVYGREVALIPGMALTAASMGLAASGASYQTTAAAAVAISITTITTITITLALTITITIITITIITITILLSPSAARGVYPARVVRGVRRMGPRYLSGWVDAVGARHGRRRAPEARREGHGAGHRPHARRGRPRHGRRLRVCRPADELPGRPGGLRRGGRGSRGGHRGRGSGDATRLQAAVVSKAPQGNGRGATGSKNPLHIRTSVFLCSAWF